LDRQLHEQPNCSRCVYDEPKLLCKKQTVWIHSRRNNPLTGRTFYRLLIKDAKTLRCIHSWRKARRPIPSQGVIRTWSKPFLMSKRWRWNVTKQVTTLHHGAEGITGPMYFAKFYNSSSGGSSPSLPSQGLIFGHFGMPLGISCNGTRPIIIDLMNPFNESLSNVPR